MCVAFDDPVVKLLSHMWWSPILLPVIKWAMVMGWYATKEHQC